ncbi:MAG: polysaccharide biosynthesis C-terminal domain-containing protein [Candidatus Thiodiazotropha sp.]
MIDKKKLFKNIFSNWVNLGVNIIISFFLAPFIVHKLGNIYYGVWVIVMQFTGYLYLLDFGVRESIIRYVSKFKTQKNTNELNEVLSSGLLLYGGIAIICLLISVIFSYSYPYIFEIDNVDLPTISIVIIICGLTIAQTIAFNVFNGILMGLQRYDIFNIIGVVFAFVRLGLILYFLNLGYGIVALSLIQLVIGLANSLSIYFYSKHLLVENKIPFHYSKTPLKTKLPVLKKLYNYSVYVLINNLGQKAIFYTDALVIGAFSSVVSVTFYAIAGNLIEYLRRLIMMSNSVLNPVASELEASNNTKSINSLIINGSKLSLLLALPICIVFFLMGDMFIGIWMGEEYVERSSVVLYILAFSTLIAVPHTTISSILYGINKHKIIANLRILEAISNLALSIVLIHYLGIAGVALGTAIPQAIFMVVVLPILTKREVDFDYKKYLLNVYLLPFFACIPFAGSIYYISVNHTTSSMIIFFMWILLLLPIYMISVFMFCFSQDERSLFTNYVNSKMKNRLSGNNS